MDDWCDGLPGRFLEGRLYLVRETKATDDLEELDWDEKMRILFGAKHFEAAPNGKVDFTHTTGEDLKIPVSEGADGILLELDAPDKD